MRYTTSAHALSCKRDKCLIYAQEMSSYVFPVREAFIGTQKAHCADGVTIDKDKVVFSCTTVENDTVKGVYSNDHPVKFQLSTHRVGTIEVHLFCLFLSSERFLFVVLLHEFTHSAVHQSDNWRERRLDGNTPKYGLRQSNFQTSAEQCQSDTVVSSGRQ